ncbi:hypothetical protein RDABS01_019781 [Bienertia sinuspersici]
MPSKLKKAISAMKDQTSISLAKVGGADSSNLEVSILKATTHDEVPVDERYITEILRIVSSNRSYAGSCARAIGRRIGRTRSWVVAVKSLILVLRVFQDGDPHFPKEVLHAMKRGYKILNLNSFRDDSSASCPWDFTAFVRTFALYLDERLDCFLTGKLQRRTSYHRSGQSKGSSRKREPVVRDMKPSVLLDRIIHWQKLLDRAIATQPTGAAKTNQLVQICLYTIVQETFELYRDISDGLALLLDSFFHLQYNNCVSAFQTCVKASKQFEELCAFYDLCKSVGIGRTSEYPSVQRVSEELIETLQEFLKDQSSFPGTNSNRTAHLPPLSPNSESTSAVGVWEKPHNSANDTASAKSDPADHRGINSVIDLLSLDDPPVEVCQDPKSSEVNNDNHQGLNSSSGKGWELVLFETSANDQASAERTNNHVRHQSNVGSNNSGFELDLFSDFNAPSTSSLPPLPNERRGFPTDLGVNFAEFGSTNGNVMHQHAKATEIPPTFSVDFGNSNNNLQDDFFDDLSRSSNFSSNTNTSIMTHGGFIEHNRSISSSFLEDFSQANANASTTAHHARFASGDISSSAFGGAFNNARFSVNSPNIHHNRYGSNISNNSSVYLDAFDSFGGYNNGIVPPSFAAESRDENANNMSNAIVPFGQMGNNDFFSTGPSLQATPTFRATSVDMDQHQQSSSWNVNDPFEPFQAFPNNANDQQQFWLQNQGKIVDKHLT